jgi:hypothetical protein
MHNNQHKVCEVQCSAAGKLGLRSDEPQVSMSFPCCMLLHRVLGKLWPLRKRLDSQMLHWSCSILLCLSLCHLECRFRAHKSQAPCDSARLPGTGKGEL